MIKIRNNIDLKELEKFGFTDMLDTYGYYCRDIKAGSYDYLGYRKTNPNDYISYFVGIDENREVEIYLNVDDDIRFEFSHADKDIKEHIRDLEKAGLIEIERR